MTLPLLLAHLVTSGLGPVYDGIVHFLLTPEDLVPVLALSLLAGLLGSSNGRLALFVLPTAWIVGGAIGLAARIGISPAWTTASFLAFGVLLAAEARLSPRATGMLAALLGLFHGFSNGAAMSGPAGGIRALLGAGVAVFVLASLAAGLAVSLRRPWTRIAARVAGSWIAAIGLLLLGWTLRGSLR